MPLFVGLTSRMDGGAHRVHMATLRSSYLDAASGAPAESQYQLQNMGEHTLQTHQTTDPSQTTSWLKTQRIH